MLSLKDTTEQLDIEQEFDDKLIRLSHCAVDQRAAVVLQSILRMALKKNWFKESLHNIIICQAAIRRFLARRRILANSMWWLYARFYAAQKMQSHVRVFFVRQQLERFRACNAKKHPTVKTTNQRIVKPQIDDRVQATMSTDSSGNH
jgi:hypothetical protein